ncbi:peptidase S8/S53 domain-containing protein [Blastocladiella britannica]|nr:peptidase S8/S53 domain-containing protein [Blastocladiella britannica]
MHIAAATTTAIAALALLAVAASPPSPLSPPPPQKDLALFQRRLLAAAPGHLERDGIAAHLTKRGLAPASLGTCPPRVFITHNAAPNARTDSQRVLVRLSRTCPFSALPSSFPSLVEALGGSVVADIRELNAHVVQWPNADEQHWCEMHLVPCIENVEEDRKLRRYQAPPASSSSRPPSSTSSSARPAGAATPTPTPAPGAAAAAAAAAPGDAASGAATPGTPAGMPQITVPAPIALLKEKPAPFPRPLHLKIKTMPDNATDLPSINDNGVQFNLWGLDLIDGYKNDLFTTEYTGASAHVYILDSGVEYRHRDFNGRASIDFIADSLKSNPIPDCNGHGTHVAGIIGGALTGVARKSNLHMLRVIGCLTEANNLDIITGLTTIAPNLKRPAVVHMSLGPHVNNVTQEFDPAPGLVEMLNYYTQTYNVPVIVAAGNDNKNKCSPIGLGVKDVVMVGAIQKYTFDLWDNTVNVPRVEFSNYGDCVQLFAPGEEIWSLDKDSSFSNYVHKQGTSQAAPFVTGIVAHLFDKYNGKQLTPAQVRSELQHYSQEKVFLRSEDKNTQDSKLLRSLAYLPLSQSTIDESFLITGTIQRGINNRPMKIFGVTIPPYAAFVAIGAATLLVMCIGLISVRRCMHVGGREPKIIGAGGKLPVSMANLPATAGSTAASGGATLPWASEKPGYGGGKGGLELIPVRSPGGGVPASPTPLPAYPRGTAYSAGSSSYNGPSPNGGGYSDGPYTPPPMYGGGGGGGSGVSQRYGPPQPAYSGSNSRYQQDRYQQDASGYGAAQPGYGYGQESSVGYQGGGGGGGSGYGAPSGPAAYRGPGAGAGAGYGHGGGSSNGGYNPGPSPASPRGYGGGGGHPGASRSSPRQGGW